MQRLLCLSMSLAPVEGYEDYYFAEVSSFYGEVKQRWVMFQNRKRRISEQKTLTKRMKKQSLKEANNLKKLGKKAFLCRDDALKAFALWQKQCDYCQSDTEPEIISKPCYKKVIRKL